MGRPWRKRAVTCLKLVVAVGLLYWLLSSGRLDFRPLAALGDRWPWLLAAQLSSAAALLTASARWRLLLRAQRLDCSLRGVGSLTLIGWFFNQVVIGTTGGDLFRAYSIASEHPGQRSAGIVSVFADRGLGLLVLLALVTVAALWNLELVRAHLELSSFAGAVSVILAGAVSAGLIFYSRTLRDLAVTRWVSSRIRFPGLLKRIDEAIYAYRFHPREVTLAALASLVIHLLTVTTNIFLALALLEQPFQPIQFLLLVPMAHAAMALPINPPGAIGTAEAIYAHLFGLAGISQGALICVLQRLTFYLWALPGAWLYVSRKGPQIHTDGSPEESGSADGGGSSDPLQDGYPGPPV